MTIAKIVVTLVTLALVHGSSIMREHHRSAGSLAFMIYSSRCIVDRFCRLKKAADISLLKTAYDLVDFVQNVLNSECPEFKVPHSVLMRRGSWMSEDNNGCQNRINSRRCYSFLLLI